MSGFAARMGPTAGERLTDGTCEDRRAARLRFALGRWRVHNRKIADIPDPACTDWVEFDAISEMRPILGGLGNFDTFIPLGLPAEKSFEGATLRTFDPGTGLWRIWWMSTR